jgi:hypothetical protein
MNKFWLTLIFIFPLANIHGQKANSTEELLRSKLQKYCATIPWEEIYIHSDRNEYIAGEDIWLTVYLFDRQKNRLTEYNSIAYFELLNSDNLQILKKRINLAKGVGPAHLVLPDTLSTGHYIMRAYTNWMKNFLPANCFTMEINIYNALNEHTGKAKHLNMFFTPDLNAGSVSGLNNNRGVKLDVNNLKPDELDIKLLSEGNNIQSNNGNFTLLIQTHGEVEFVRSVKLGSQVFQLSIPKEVLSPGINQIVVFDEVLRPLCERYVYTPLKDSARISFKCQDSYKTREKVNIMFGFGDQKEEPGRIPDISISVRPSEGTKSETNIDEFMVFGTEFGILPESIRSHHLREIPPAVIDSFLVNAKSKWIDWSEVISGRLPEIKYEIEKDCHFLTGSLVNKKTKIAESGKYLFLSKPGKKATFQYSRTDSTGNFRFSLPISDKIMDLIIQPELADVNSSVMITPSFSEEFAQESTKPDTNNAVSSEYINRWGVNHQVKKIYGISSAGEPLKTNFSIPEPKRFYGKPDITLTMDDYIKLPVMEEVFFELTPGVQLKRKKSTYFMTIYDPVSNKPYEKPPIVFIDGVVINDLGVVAAMDPEIVERIEVIKDLYLVGDYIFFGVVNIITRTGDCGSVSLPDYVIRMNYRVVDPIESFSSPEYKDELSKKSRIPDFRNTLYWNSSVRPDENGNGITEFWTSDSEEAYEISLQGVNQQGQPVSFRKVIKVE